MQVIDVCTGFHEDRHCGYLVPAENAWGYQVSKTPVALEPAEARRLVNRAGRNENMDHFSFITRRATI